MEDALRTLMINQVDGKAENIFLKFATILLKNHLTGQCSYRLPLLDGSPWMKILSPGRKCPPGTEVTSGITFKQIER